jgi:hypothetical protein
MNNKLIFTLVFVGFGVACGGDDDGARRSQQGYETVQEGSAAGVTSTIQGPGEALPPLTGTNADTTTAFTIDPNAVASSAPPAQSAPGTLAGTMPPISTQYPPPMTSSPATAAPSPSRSTAPPVRTQPAPQREPAAQPPDTDTAVTPTEPAPPTQTAAPTQTAPPTNTAPPPPPRQEEEEEEEEEDPPPPTSTDTRGGQR